MSLSVVYLKWMDPDVEIANEITEKYTPEKNKKKIHTVFVYKF